MTDRFHKAARDGYLDALKEATRKDCNSKDEDGMTPTLWAAFEGNLEALRLLVGRGGDPEKCDNFGNTAMHLCAAKGHLNCVSYLANFGVSLWALDIDSHTAKDLAAINNKQEILKYLDTAGAQQETNNPKDARRLQEKAKKDSEARAKKFKKIQEKAEREATKESEKIDLRRKSLFPTALTGNKEEIPNMGRRASIGVPAFSSLSGGKSTLSAPKFSEMTGTVASRKMKSGVLSKIQKKNQDLESGFTVREKGTIRSIPGLRSENVNEIMFVDKEGGTGEGKGGLREMFNQDQEETMDNFASEPVSIFNRGMMGGTLAFRNSISAFNALSIHGQGDSLEDKNEDSIGSAGSLAHRSDRSNGGGWGSHRNGQISEEEEDELSDDGDGVEYTSLQMFLAAVGLHDWTPKFIKEKIDLEALMLLSEADLAEVLGMPLGPRKKLMKKVKERKADMEGDEEELKDSRL